MWKAEEREGGDGERDDDNGRNEEVEEKEEEGGEGSKTRVTPQAAARVDALSSPISGPVSSSLPVSRSSALP